MKLIAHRGNTVGRFESWENEPTYIDKAINEGFDVEIDVWYVNKVLYLGHDTPQYGVNVQWLIDRTNSLWIHCKNIEAVQYFNDHDFYNLNYFWHETDTVTLTSRKFIWAYPGKQPIKGSIAVMPEIFNDDISSCMGVCSDHIRKYKDETKA